MSQKKRNDGRDLLEPRTQRQHNSRHFDDGLSYGCGERGRLSRTSFEPQGMLRRLHSTTQNRLSCVTFAPRPLRDSVGNSCFTAPQFWSSVLLDTLARVTFSFCCSPKEEQVVNLRCVTSDSSLTGSCSTVVHMTSLSHEDSTTCRTHIFFPSVARVCHMLCSVTACTSVHFWASAQHEMKLKLFSNKLTHCSAPFCENDSTPQPCL